MRRIITVLLLLITIASPLFGVEVSSPDGNYKVIVTVSEEGMRSSLRYEVWYKGVPIVLPSKAHLNLKRPLDMFENMRILRVDSSEHHSQWTAQYGERAIIPDSFHEVTLTIHNALDSLRHFEFICRAYNEGIAFRFNFPELRATQILDIIEEEVEFTMPEGTHAFFSPRSQAAYAFRPMTTWPVAAEKPLTMLLPDSIWVSITEAQLVNYSGMRLTLSRSSKNTLNTTLFGPVTETSPFATPWRVIMAAEKAGDLVENNYLTLNLNPPAQGDWSWVRPGKAIRAMDMTLEGVKRSIDFAVSRHLQYVLIDAGWYGDEYLADSRVVKKGKKGDGFNNPDMCAILKYARRKRIGIWLYVNHRELEKDLDDIFSLFGKSGVKGVKFGFVHTGSHRWATWLAGAVRKAASHKLMVDIHDEYRPTGLSRTFPNLLTQEGVLGNEAMPDATHNTVLPFTRMLAGATDYTVSYYMREELTKANKYIRTTPAHQLALPVIYFSPLQVLFWYDRPEDYQGEQEIELWQRLPVTWDETRVVDGMPGTSAIVARRSREEWFIGAITNTESRNLDIPLDFLTPGRLYEALVYYDDPGNSTSRTKISLRKFEVDASTVITEAVLPSGGVAIHISPKQLPSAEQ